MRHLTQQRAIWTAAILAAIVLTSCYRITLIIQDHKAYTHSTFKGKMVVKRAGTASNGIVQHVHGLFGICVPRGWQAAGDIVMTQVPKNTTDVGDDAYKQTITRQLTANERYTALLNADYPKAGYTWLGFATEQDFKSLFDAENEAAEVDSIYVEFSIKTDGQTGTFYLDYIAGQTDAGKLETLGDTRDGWNTRVATFADNNITTVTTADTHITVTRPDGTMDEMQEDPAIEAAWNLVPMPEAIQRQGLKVKAYKDKLYDGLFTRSRGWNGGDGVFSVGLPNGDVYWTFNDSFYGVVNDGRARGSSSFPRNSIMLQRNSGTLPGETPSDLVWLADYVNWKQPTADRYFQCRTHIRHPLATKTAAEIATGDIDSDYLYWSGDGHIYDGKLQMLWFGVDNRDGNMINISTAIATYSLEGSIPQGYYLNDIPDYLPRQGNYMYLEEVKHNVNYNPVPYGSTLWEDEDGHLYLYANSSYNTVVARTATHDLNSPWQYYVHDADNDTWTWQDSYPSEEQIAASSIVNTGLSLPWVFKEGDWYYLVSQGSFFSKQVYLFRSNNPYGPFTDQRELFTLPSTLDKLGVQTYRFVYMVNIHPALSRQGELVFTTNTDTESFWDNFNETGSADFYRPYFYRVFNWKTLYPDITEAATDIGHSTLTKTEKGDEGIYALDGRRMAASPSLRDTLPKGIYICQRKKIVIK